MWTKSQLEDAARLAAAAFVDSPSYAYIFAELDAPARLAALAWLFSRNFALRASSTPDALRGVFDERERCLNCFFMLLPPDKADASFLRMVWSGLLALPFRFGWGSFTRLLEVKSRHEALEADFCAALAAVRPNDPPPSTLERMVVRPEAQGRGIGSKALGATLSQPDLGYVVRSTQL